MKKRWKVFWIVCGITAGIGFACCIAALALGVTVEMLENRFPNGIGIVSGNHGSESTSESYGGVQKIDMDLAAGEVIVLPSDNQETVVVETENISRRLKFSTYMEGNELKITSAKWLLFGKHIGKGKIYVYIPQNQTMEEVSLDMGAGNLTVENLWAKKFSLSVGAGDAEVWDFTAQEADFDCGTGKITACGGASRGIDIDCGVGDIEYTAYGNERDYNYDIDCGVGDVVIGANEYSGLGRSKNVNNGADREISIDCGVGKVNVAFDSSRQAAGPRMAARRTADF